ncbi:hypothetical protein VFPBJ_04776 [Purpureocillium lilacinum]|uniref:Uncharacterized protein n=1 Tax=Purpureocillium lilacinum TaxID=33203 RepID=A0A179GWP6_PURLI|nr:hypothetical protein VFPBJ_04776 [Purpureocillium lilacinum]
MEEVVVGGRAREWAEEGRAGGRVCLGRVQLRWCWRWRCAASGSRFLFSRRRGQLAADAQRVVRWCGGGEGRSPVAPDLWAAAGAASAVQSGSTVLGEVLGNVDGRTLQRQR